MEVKLRLLDALACQRLRASGLCSCGGGRPKDHAFSRCLTGADGGIRSSIRVRQAAAVVQDARAALAEEFVISAPLVYAAWGLVWLIGYGAMWLSVAVGTPTAGPRVSRSRPCSCWPVSRPRPSSAIASKAVAGIDGRPCDTAGIILATWATGYLILLIVQAAISGSVSTRTVAFLGFAGPVLLAGLTCASPRPRTGPAGVRLRSLARARRCQLRMAGTRGHPGHLRARAGGGAFLLNGRHRDRLQHGRCNQAQPRHPCARAAAPDGDAGHPPGPGTTCPSPGLRAVRADTGNLITHLRKLGGRRVTSATRSSPAVASTPAPRSVSLAWVARRWTPTWRSCGSCWIQPASTRDQPALYPGTAKPNQSVFAGRLVTQEE